MKKLFQDAENAILGNAANINEVVLQYRVMAGEISKAEVEQLRLDKSIGDMESKLKSANEEKIAALKTEILLQNRIRMAEDKRLDALQDAGRFMRAGGGMTEEARAHVDARAVAERKIADTRRELAALEKDGVDRVKAQVDEYSRAVEEISRLKKEEQKRKERDRQRSKAIAAAQQRQNDLVSIFNKLQSESDRILSGIRDKEIARLDPVSRVQAEYQREIDSLREIERAAMQELQTAQRIASWKKEKAKLVEIEAEKERLLAATKKAMDDAEIQRQIKLSGVLRKQAQERSKHQDRIAANLERDNQKNLSLVSELQALIRDANQDQLSDLEKINQQEQERLAKLVLIGKQLGVNTEEAEKAIKGRAKRERATIQKSDQEGIVSSITASLDASGLVSSICALFGPMGSMISGAITALSDLGQKDPEQIRQEFEATFQGISKGIQILIPMLIEVLPPILFEAVQLLINAILQIPSMIVAGINRTLTSIAGKIRDFFKDGFLKAIGTFFRDMIDNLVDLIMGPFEGLFGGSKMGGGKMLSGMGGLRFTGSRRGLAMLHEGETVVPASGQVSSTVQQRMQEFSGGGKSVTININSAVTERSAIDDLVRKIEQRFRGFGGATSPLFGGV